MNVLLEEVDSGRLIFCQKRKEQDVAFCIYWQQRQMMIFVDASKPKGKKKSNRNAVGGVDQLYLARPMQTDHLIIPSFPAQNPSHPQK